MLFKNKWFTHGLTVILQCFVVHTCLAVTNTNGLTEENKNAKQAEEQRNKKSDEGVKQRTKKIFGLITDNHSKHFNISRLQLRATDEGSINFTQSIFYRFPNKMFLAQAYEYRQHVNDDPDFNYFVWNFGGPMPLGSWSSDNLYGWVVRGQYATQTDDAYSIGLQYNFSDLKALQPLKQHYKLTSFLQVFPYKSNNAQGNWDVLLYYSFKLYKKLYLRGNTNFIKFDDKNYIRSFQDIIYPIGPDFDIYVRLDYQNRNDVQFGELGTQYSLGIRYNFSF